MEYVHVELKRDTWIQPEMKVRTPEDAVTAVQKVTENLDREMLICIHMAASGRVISASVCSVGSMDQSIVSPAEILRTALAAGAKSIILLHNHPSGDCMPSSSDFDVTKRMIHASMIIGMTMLDHIVLGEDGKRYSFRKMHEELFGENERWNLQASAAEHRRSI